MTNENVITIKKYLVGLASFFMGVVEILTPHTATVQLIERVLGLDSLVLALLASISGAGIIYMTYKGKRLNGILVTPLNFYIVFALYRLIDDSSVGGLYPVLFYAYVLLDTTVLTVSQMVVKD